MSKTKKIKIVMLAFAVAVGMISTIVAADMANNTPVPGSADDPLVTLSYVTNTLKPQIQAEILAALNGSDVSAILDALNSNNAADTGNQQSTPTPEPEAPPTLPAPDINANNITDAEVSYEVVELMLGQKIRPLSGSIELIARPGTVAVALTPYTDQGVGNLTDGTEILNNQNIPINHSLLIPRADGRAVQILCNVAYIMVRGNYEIIN